MVEEFCLLFLASLEFGHEFGCILLETCKMSLKTSWGCDDAVSIFGVFVGTLWFLIHQRQDAPLG